jgi:hypothetical protein
LLCAVTSTLCAALLGRSFVHSRSALLMWSLLCFVGLAVNNILLFVDLTIVPEMDLSIWRTLAALIGIGAMVLGLIWEDQ